MPCFLWNLCFGPTNTTIEINQLTTNLNNYNNDIITNFTKKLKEEILKKHTINRIASMDNFMKFSWSWTL